MKIETIVDCGGGGCAMLIIIYEPPICQYFRLMSSVWIHLQNKRRTLCGCLKTTLATRQLDIIVHVQY